MSSEPRDPAAEGLVVVGYDGSSDAGLAVDWAALEASRLGARLGVVIATHGLGVPPAVGFIPVPEVRRAFEDRQREWSAHAVHRARRFLPEARIDSAVIVDRTVPALVEASEHADLVVVGHRGHRGITSTLGSVSIAVAERARCPAVVVRGASELGSEPRRPVTVGVDGTSESKHALRFAAETAARWGVSLTVICAWIPPQMGWNYGDLHAVSLAGWSELAGKLSSFADQVAQAATADARSQHPDLDVNGESPEQDPALALEEASRTSSLAVVGASGSSSLAGLLLGSVSRSVLHRASCPVAVART
jgi:nucleotide-binding universal stress UspA family protein